MTNIEPKRLQAIIFDWAGTTMDYGCFAPAVAFVEAFSQVGFDLSIREARVPMGLKKDVHIKEILSLGERYRDRSEMQAVRERWREHYGRLPTEEDAAAVFERFVPAQIACLPKYADLIPGTLETIAYCREQGMKVGSTTGYMGHDTDPEKDMMRILLQEAEKRGYVPDVSVCATGNVAVRDEMVEGGWRYDKTHMPQARPAPWMCLENAKQLNIYPPWTIVKVDDTPDGVAEGVNAGMWTIGLIKTGSDMGLTEDEVNALPSHERHRRLVYCRQRMEDAGANFIVWDISDVPDVLGEINGLLSQGYRSNHTP